MNRFLLALAALATLSAAATPAPITVALTYTGKDTATRETFARIKATVAAEPAFRLVSTSAEPRISLRLHDVRRTAEALSFRYATYVPQRASRQEWTAACTRDHEQDCADGVLQTLDDLADQLNAPDRP